REYKGRFCKRQASKIHEKIRNIAQQRSLILRYIKQQVGHRSATTRTQTLQKCAKSLQDLVKEYNSYCAKLGLYSTWTVKDIYDVDSEYWQHQYFIDDI